MSEFSQLKSNVSKELGLDETANGNDDILLGRRLNQAVRKVLIETKCRVAVASTALTADVADYELPADVLALNNIKNSDEVPLERASVEEIHDLRRGSASTGSAGVYKYAVDGANLLMLYPTPSSAETLTLYYVPKPTEMSSSAHDPSTSTYGGIPVEYHDLIEYWAAYRLAQRLRHQESQFGMTYKQLYDQHLFEVRREIRRRGGRKLGPVRRVRRMAVRRDPSQT